MLCFTSPVMSDSSVAQEKLVDWLVVVIRIVPALGIFFDNFSSFQDLLVVTFYFDLWVPAFLINSGSRN